MKKMFQAATVAAMALAVPALSLAAQTKAPAPRPAPTTAASAPAPAKPAMKTAKAAMHSARGVVKSVDATTLVITEKAGKTTHDMQFVLDNSTQKEGAVAVGSSVTVKYHTDGAQHVASSVKASAAKKS